MIKNSFFFKISDFEHASNYQTLSNEPNISTGFASCNLNDGTQFVPMGYKLSKEALF